MNEEQEQTMSPKPVAPTKVDMAPIQSKFLKFVWLVSARDWTNEIIIVGVLLLAAMDLRYASIAKEAPQLANTIGGGLIGYLVKGAIDLKESGIK